MTQKKALAILRQAADRGGQAHEMFILYCNHQDDALITFLRTETPTCSEAIWEAARTLAGETAFD